MPVNRESYQVGDNFLTGYGILTIGSILHKKTGDIYTLQNERGIHILNASKEQLDATRQLPRFNDADKAKSNRILNAASDVSHHCSDIESSLNVLQDSLNENDDDLHNAIENILLSVNVVTQRADLLRRLATK